MNKSNYPESFVLFEVAGNTCGVRSKDVRSVEAAGDLTPVPDALPVVGGVTLTPGQNIPSINLRTRFGFPAIPVDSRARMVVVCSKLRTVGMLVDSAREFTSIPPETIQPAGDRIVAFSARYLEGVATLGKRSVLVLNLDAVIGGV